MNQIDHKKLIDAINLLARHGEQHLPHGWEITLHFTCGEAWIDLTDPEGNDHDVLLPDANQSAFHEMCETAAEIQMNSEER